MESINLSVNPSYYCNFRCSFCYLSNEQLADAKRLDLNVLLEKLTEISATRKISHIDLYGGEVGLLPKEYLDRLLRTLGLFYRKPVNVITNLSYINPRFLESDIDLSVSWDGPAREKSELVYRNMLALEKPFHILILASDRLLMMSEAELDDFIGRLNRLGSLETVEIKPYSLNAFKSQSLGFREYEEFIIRWMKRRHNFGFDWINESKIRDSLSKQANAWSDDHLYLTPDGEWAVLEFDEQQREFFKPLKNLADYEEWIRKERRTVESSPACAKCGYLGHCLSEHLQKVTSLDKSCNGFYHLLKWSENAGL